LLGSSAALVTLVVLSVAAVPQPLIAAVEPSPSPQTDGKLLIITVPQGGSVRSLSDNHLCGAGETCEIPINDGFHEVFIPWHEVGYRFNAWKQSSEHFCGGHIVKCTITAGSADSATRLEPIFDRDVASTGYEGIRKLDYSDMGIEWPLFGSARAFADFNGDGILDLFMAVGKWLTIERQRLEMWIGRGDGTYSQDEGVLADQAVGGYHPRKAVAADFNGDDKADVIVADHGYDTEPYPGAPLLLYLSTADGRLEKVKGLEYLIGFFHSVAAGDVDGDGDTDAFVTAFYPAFLINDGKGNMTVNRTYLPKRYGMEHAGYYTSELIDVDRDGHLDLLIAGHEYPAAPSLIVWGNEGPGFADSTATTLPKVIDFGIVVDIDVADFDGDGINDVLLNRAGSAPGRDFYDGMYLQLLKGKDDLRTFSDITESSIDNNKLLNTYHSEYGNWFLWLIAQDWDLDGDLDIVVDPDIASSGDQGLFLINNGKSVFSILEVAQP